MTTMTLRTSSPDVSLRSERAARAAVDRVMGDDVSPELKKAASDAVAPWAERLVRWLDDLIRIPGTKLGVGLDPIVGFLIPGAGDVITGAGSIGLLFLALKERLPTIVFLRMCMNIVVDTVGGLFPFVGDAFDLVWRSNKRNLELIEKYRGEDKPAPTFADYALVGLGVILALLSVAIPLVIIYGIGLGAILGLSSIFGG